MVLLVLGIALWVMGHFLKRAAPGARASLGDKGKVVVAVAIWGGLILIILGYRAAPMIPVWYPSPVMIHFNNLLMLVAFYIFGIGMAKGRHAQKIRHPMLTGVAIWGVAHLLVNGDLASVLLFGSMLIWAIAEIVTINRLVPVWVKPEVIRPNGDLKGFAVSCAVFAVVGGVHVLAGLSPFG